MNEKVQSQIFIHDGIGLVQFVIPVLTRLALACPVLDTGYLICGNPVLFWIPAFAGMTLFEAIHGTVYNT